MKDEVIECGELPRPKKKDAMIENGEGREENSAFFLERSKEKA